MYNNSEYLYECIDSVLCQTYSDVELIIVDDYSEVFDKKGIELYISQNKRENLVNVLVYQNSENFGTVRSINRAIDKSNGEYIRFLAADDALYDEDTLFKTEKVLCNSPCGIVVSDVIRCDTGLNPIEKIRLPIFRSSGHFLNRLNSISPFKAFQMLCVANRFITGGVSFTRGFFKEYGLFDECYRLLEDWPTWLRITKSDCEIQYFPFLVYKYRSNVGVSTSSNPVLLEDNRKVLENIIIPSKKDIGLVYYLSARLYFFITQSEIVRKCYRLIFGTLRRERRES